MSLSQGTKLGPYEIVAAIGAGGMGEVYRARDTRLGRDVAIKVLPLHLSSDPQLKERFDREARSISSLNHARICTLHDVGHQEGIDFLVMEYLEGETLAERLRKGPMALKDWNGSVRGAGRGAPGRDCPSRPEARQHHADEKRREADGLRLGEGNRGQNGRER